MGRLHLAASRRIARNENGIPFDPEKPAIAFGVRLVARIGADQFKKVGELSKLGNAWQTAVRRLKIC
jgi:glycine/serine hydroxymethyltransferase